ncbi:MAG: alpha-glucosidase [Bacteroidota bacterium]
MKKTWWKESVVYQIYPRSFKDSNGDGIGDLKGVIEKLDHIKSLGVDVIWLCPVYKSPNDDNGYDISDYYNIMDEFGDMATFDELLQGIHERQMKLVMDLVVNHTSDEHQWFTESKKSKDNPYRDYYIWKQGENGGPPNNWTSFFSGSAWQLDEATGEYYLHLFSKKQPDLNWENPKVREEVYQLMRFWLDKGVDGFRMDVIPLISKRQDYPSVGDEKFLDVIENVYSNGPRVHEYLNEMNREVISQYDMMTIGEGIGIRPEQANLYVGEDRNELHMIFHFGHMFIDSGEGGKYDIVPWKLSDFKDVFNQWDENLGEDGWGSIYLGNHDFSRSLSRFGNDDEYWSESAKLLATLLLTLRGTVYIYQGDEIGMTNVAYPSVDDYRDIESLNSYHEAVANGQDADEWLKALHIQSRDNARTPIQWDNAPHGGFTSGAPWIKVNENYANINVASQENDPDSILNYFRKAVKFRKDHKGLVYGSYRSINNEDESIYAYLREFEGERYFVILNFTSEEQPFDMGAFGDFGGVTSLLSNYKDEVLEGNMLKLRPWEASVYQSV